MYRTRLALSVALLTLACLLLPARAGDYPEPSPYPVSWDLKFEHGKLKRIVVDVPKQGRTAYWYLPFRVTNETGQEQLFLPLFEMVTSDGKVHRSDKGIPARVFQKIKEAEGNQFLERRTQIVGTLREGEDQARDGVAIWQEPMAEMGQFSIFITGLSGEAVVCKIVDGKLIPVDPRNIREELKGVPPEQQVSLRKTLQLDYVVYGDEKYAEKDDVVVKGQKWVMR